MQKTNAIKKLCAVAMISIVMVSCGDVEGYVSFSKYISD
mgnify:CR=1 FL=1